jgi:hypothetical protein
MRGYGAAVEVWEIVGLVIDLIAGVGVVFLFWWHVVSSMHVLRRMRGRWSSKNQNRAAEELGTRTSTGINPGSVDRPLAWGHAVSTVAHGEAA